MKQLYAVAMVMMSVMNIQCSEYISLPSQKRLAAEFRRMGLGSLDENTGLSKYLEGKSGSEAAVAEVIDRARAINKEKTGRTPF